MSVKFTEVIYNSSDCRIEKESKLFLDEDGQEAIIIQITAFYKPVIQADLIPLSIVLLNPGLSFNPDTFKEIRPDD